MDEESKTLVELEVILTDSFTSTNRRVELYLDKDNSNSGWEWYGGRCDTDELEDRSRSATDLGAEGVRLVIDMFLEEDEFLINRLEDGSSFSSEENSFLETKYDSIEGVDGGMVTTWIFLDRYEVAVDELEDCGESSFEVSSFLGTKGDWIEGEEIKVLSR